MLVSRIFLKRFQPFTATFSTRSYCTCPPKNFKVAIAGAAGEIGRHLALLLKQCDLVRELALYDLKKAKGLAADLSQLEALAKVKGYEGKNEINDAFQNANVIVITAGKPRNKKQRLSREDSFNSNAPILKELLEAASKASPKALIAIDAVGLNAALPLAHAVLKEMGTFDPKRLFGVTLLHEIRANTFVAKFKGLDPACVSIPVFGGSTPTTIVPILSRMCPQSMFSCEESRELIKLIRTASEEVTKAKGVSQHATLSSAYAIAKFVTSLLQGLSGECAQTTAYIKSDVTCAKFFSNRILVGKNGLEKNLGVEIESLDSETIRMLKKAYVELNKDIMVAEYCIKDMKTGKKAGEKEKDDNKEKNEEKKKEKKKNAK